ncbi:response regulator [Flavobacterium sp.]|uniref:response regulator n=1 Tax=Flavobacterium sp. TaxID=239 RepID=UPI003BDF3656
MAKEIKSILLIEDDLAINYFHKRLFLKLEISNSVLPFFNVSDALKELVNLNTTLSKNDLVFIFLDINMPEIDGWSFLEEFDKIRSTLIGEFKIFFLSGSINPEDIEKAKNNNLVTNYYAKPLMMEGILELKEIYS